MDRIAGGRQAGVRVPDEVVQHPRTRRAFRWIGWLLAAELVIGLGAVVIAVVLALNGVEVPFAVWMRSVVVLGMTATLFYFFWRATLGWRWGYQRLRLFSQIFPVITLVMAAIPGLYPGWMITEQIIFSLIMIGIADFLTSDHMRDAFRRSGSAESPESPDRP
nr:hypothetical protein [Leucobacter edaphi]